MGYDVQATKERILVAATAEFAEHGVAGARVDRIAVTAKANKRAIYDYFGDKEALFAAVLERELLSCAEEVPLDGSDLAGYAARLFDYHAAHPEFVRLLMWEALELGQGPVPAEAARAEKYQRRAEAITAPGLDARLLLFFTMALVNWAAAAPQLRRMVLGEGFSDADLRAAISQAVRALYQPSEGMSAGE